MKEINRDLDLTRQLQEREERQRFEINRLRSQILRQQRFPNVTGPDIEPGCPPGTAGCD